eukprot:1495362-Pyramimonas_sp.AAC.2
MCTRISARVVSKRGFERTKETVTREKARRVGEGKVIRTCKRVGQLQICETSRYLDLGLHNTSNLWEYSLRGVT